MTVVASNYARRENDLYQTEPWATRAMLKHVPIGHRSVVWEPSAGNHLMADVIRETGARVLTSDIATYDRPHDGIFDFLNEPPHNGILSDAIITNPPYGKQNRDAVKYARLALERCKGWVALLLTAKFDFGKTRTDLFANNDRFFAKIALLDRIQWFEGPTTGTEDSCWAIWGPKNGAPYQPRMFWEGKDAR